MDREKIDRCNRIYPWFSGLSADLLFFIAIDTLWFTVEKGMDSFRILAMFTVAAVATLVLQRPMLRFIEKAGNTVAVRMGVIFMLAGAVFMTFPTNYGMIVFGQSAYKFGTSMKAMDAALLKNNLNLLEKPEDQFISLRNHAMTVYAVVTCVIAFVAGPMFNLNHYLPMYFCIGFCIVDLVMSFFIRDYTDGKQRETGNQKEGADRDIRLSPFIITCIVVLGIFTPAIVSGQCNGKLFMQEEMMKSFSVSKTAAVLTFSIAISRIVRIVANLLFDRFYLKMKDMIIPLFSISFCLSFVIMLGSALAPLHVAPKFIIMSLGYYILLAIRDPFTTYINGLILANTSRQVQQKALVYVNLMNQIMGTAFNLCFTVLLLRFTMFSIMVITFVCSLAELVVCIRLYRMIRWSRISD